MGMPTEAQDLISGYNVNVRDAGVELKAHQFLWLRYS